MTMSYILMAMKRAGTVQVGEQLVEVPMVWADGMIGVIPVFETQEAAEKYSDGGKYQIVPIQVN